MLLNQETYSDLQEKIDSYAACVKDLNVGKRPDLPPLEAADPLAKLNRELRLLADGIARREAELAKLFKLVHGAELGLRVEDVLSQIFDGFYGIIPYDRIGCAFLSNGGTQLTAHWARTTLGPIQLGKGYTQGLQGSSLEEVFRSGEPRILNDLPAYLAAHPNSDSTRRMVLEGGRSSLTCPLFIKGRPLGMLFFTSRETNTYNYVHQAAFRQIADTVAAVIHRSRLFDDLVEENHFLLRQAEQLKIQSNCDPLTGLLNRRAMMEAFDQQLHAVKIFGTPLGVIMADIDHFKAINDSYGHAAGDRVLCEFTRRLKGELRPMDFFGRYGGEEFLILICSTQPGQLLQLANRLRRLVADTTFDFGMVRQTVTASFGVAIADSRNSKSSSVESLLEEADRALYAAKAAGRNCCELAPDRKMGEQENAAPGTDTPPLAKSPSGAPTPSQTSVKDGSSVGCSSAESSINQPLQSSAPEVDQAKPEESAEEESELVRRQEAAESYQVTEPDDVLRMLRSVQQGRQLVVMMLPDGRRILTTILTVDADLRNFVYDSGRDLQETQAVLSASRLRFSTTRAGVPLRFTATAPVAVDFKGAPAFLSPLPVTMQYLQRREYFRTRDLQRYGCSARLKDSTTVSLKLKDLSLGGAGLESTSMTPEQLPVGSLLRDAVLDFRELGRLDGVSLMVLSHKKTVVHGVSTYLYGCRFEPLPAGKTSILQRLVFSLEQLHRARNQENDRV